MLKQLRCKKAYLHIWNTSIKYLVNFRDEVVSWNSINWIYFTYFKLKLVKINLKNALNKIFYFVNLSGLLINLSEKF
jgi:hypothetical protein